MTKLDVMVINKDTGDDVTNLAEISVYNQVTDREISRRQDGYFYLTDEGFYSASARIGHSSSSVCTVAEENHPVKVEIIPLEVIE